MDGLSGAASGIAVISLALQLGDSIKQLYDFWHSVKEAPDHVRTIATELSLLSSVLTEMAFEEQHLEPDQTLTTALEACHDRVKTLTHITNLLEPGFTSRSLRIRKWTAFKAVFKAEKIQNFQKMLDGLKITLMLAQQNHHRRLDRTRYQSQQQDLTRITKVLSSLRLEQMSASVTTVSNSSSHFNEHTDALRAETFRICQRIPNPIRRVGFQLSSDIAVQDLASSLSTDQNKPSQLLAHKETDYSAYPRAAKTLPRSGQQTLRKDTSTIREYTKQTFFGMITTTTCTRVSRSRFIDDDTSDDEEYQSEYESSLNIQPAQWLLKLGFNYAYRLSTQDSSTKGWQWYLKPICLVPDDAPIFEFCERGDIEKVRDLISRKVASVRDVNSDSQTALHFAVKSCHPELCKFLIEAGANKGAQNQSGVTPLRGMLYSEHYHCEVVNIIDTCRIFEDSFNFWDEDGDGWSLLSMSDHWLTIVFEPPVEVVLMVLSWFLNLSSPDIKANYIVEIVRRRILLADDRFADVTGSLLRLGPSIDEFEPSPLLLAHINGRKFNHINMLLRLGANPHQVLFNKGISPVVESPLSLALYSSYTFRAFRTVLRDINLDTEDFIREELKAGRPLLDDGWRIETLRTVLELDMEPDICISEGFKGNNRCIDCGRKFYFDEAFNEGVRPVQVYWQAILENIKNGSYAQKVNPNTQGEYFSSHLDPYDQDSLLDATEGSTNSQDPASSSEEDEAVQSGNEINQSDGDFFTDKDDDSRTVFDKDEFCCIDCWYSSKDTGCQPSPPISKSQSLNEEDLSENDFSPYLFNT